MNTINATEEFSSWVGGLDDLKARAAIYLRIKRAKAMWKAIKEQA